MQICDVLVAVVNVIAPKFYLRNFQVSCFFLDLRHFKDNTWDCSARI